MPVMQPILQLTESEDGDGGTQGRILKRPSSSASVGGAPLKASPKTSPEPKKVSPKAKGKAKSKAKGKAKASPKKEAAKCKAKAKGAKMKDGTEPAPAETEATS